MVYKPKEVEPVHVVKEEPNEVRVIVVDAKPDEIVSDYKDDIVVNPTIG